MGLVACKAKCHNQHLTAFVLAWHAGDWYDERDKYSYPRFDAWMEDEICE